MWRFCWPCTTESLPEAPPEVALLVVHHQRGPAAPRAADLAAARHRAATCLGGDVPDERLGLDGRRRAGAANADRTSASGSPSGFWAGAAPGRGGEL